jgi:2-polyprenyl-3-methyl-5-hydroxy-6-metoxy-1,4-benzoquinol methylase
MAEIRHFIKDDGRKLPVSDDFLLPFLSPTSPGTNYWDSPPPGPMNERVLGRLLLQLHQALQLFRKCGVDFKGKKFLDIGTGTGMLPRLMVEFSEIESAVGADPYLIGEHKAGTRTTDEDDALRMMKEFILTHSPGALDYENYRQLLGYEHHTLIPERFEYQEQSEKSYRFEKIGAHDLDQLGEMFDLVYVKAIDHIADWEGIFRAVAAVANPGAVFCIKHFSFFSYLGPHRYATTNIPWGHMLLTDAEYRRFAHEFHAYREEQMVDFYFSGLSYPRTPLSELMRMAQRNGFLPQVIINEPLWNFAEIHGLTEVVDDFWEIVGERWPSVSTEEMFSGRYHIVLRRV